MELPYIPAVLLLHIYPREMKTCSHKNLYINVYSSIIHDSQKVEITQMSIHGQMEKQNMVYSHNGILFGHKENEVKRPAIASVNLEKRKKPVTEVHILYNSIHMKCPEQVNL